MRTTSAALTAAIAMVAFLSGCSGDTLSGAPITMSSYDRLQTHILSEMDASRSRIAPGFLPMRLVSAASHPNMGAKPPRELAISEEEPGVVEILNRKYQPQSTIRQGLAFPEGDWYDNDGSLYVADPDGNDVQQYGPGSTFPRFTYSSGLYDHPINVTTDQAGNVYVVGNNTGRTSFVYEYPRQVNVVTTFCHTPLANSGVAIDSRGDVFISGNNPVTHVAHIIEYKGGLNGCSYRMLGVTFGFAGGLQIDKRGNLVAADQLGVVDIIPTPYESVSSSITGFSDPRNIAINKAQNLIFVADPVKPDVVVDTYPGGDTVTTLRFAPGSIPVGVATFPNSQSY